MVLLIIVTIGRTVQKRTAVLSATVILTLQSENNSPKPKLFVRIVAILLGVFLVGVLLVFLGGHLLTRNHFVGQYVQRVAPGTASLADKDAVFQGMWAALQSCRMQSSQWVVLPDGDGGLVFQTNAQPVEVLIMLSNSTDSSRLYVMVRTNATRDSISYEIVRPK